jgi:2-C-methyl-D-erythritol 4-phosphate cytidylyltransferase
MKYSALILAAGSASRMGLDYNKVLHKIKGKRVLDYSVEYFLKDANCNQIVLVTSEHDFNTIFDLYNSKVDVIIQGGRTRQDSVYNGLTKCEEEYVLIHDSARPFLVKKCVDNLFIDVQFTKASTLAVYVKDSIVQTSSNRIEKMLDRTKLLNIQTPQAFQKDLIITAHKKARANHFIGTDDTSLISKFTDVMPSFVIGDYRNIKLTTVEDIILLEAIL